MNSKKAHCVIRRSIKKIILIIYREFYGFAVFFEEDKYIKHHPIFSPPGKIIIFFLGSKHQIQKKKIIIILFSVSNKMPHTIKFIKLIKYSIPYYLFFLPFCKILHHFSTFSTLLCGKYTLKLPMISKFFSKYS